MKIINKALNRYSSVSSIVKAAFWFTVCNVFQRGIQFLVTPIYTRLLSTYEYGMYSVFMTWMNIFAVFASLNLSSGVYYNGMLKYEADQKRYTSSVQSLGTFTTIIVFGVFVLIYPLIKDMVGLPLSISMLMFAVILVNPAFQFWSVQERLNYKYKALIGVTGLNSLLTPVIGVVTIVVFHVGYKGVIWGYVIVNIIISGCFYIMNIYKGKRLFDKEYWKFSLNFSIPLIPHYLSQVLLAQSDRVMINYYCGTGMAGIYTLAYQISLIMNLLISGINSALTPWMYRALKEQRYAEIRTYTVQLTSVIVILTVVMMVLAPELIVILGTEDYIQAKWIIPPVMVSTSITFVYCLYGTVLFYFEETKKVAIATSVGALFNIILNFIFIPRYGMIAAAYTTIAGYTLMYFFYLYYTKGVCEFRNIRFTNIFDGKRLMTVLVMLLLASFTMIIFYNLKIYIRYIFIVLLSIEIYIHRAKIWETVFTDIKK